MPDHTVSKPKKDPPKPKPSHEELVEANRERVLELDACGYLRGYIASVTRLPYAVIEEILSTKAKPKKSK